eukprot:s818_g6.t1
MDVCSATFGEVLFVLPVGEVGGLLVKDVNFFISQRLNVSRFRQRIFDANFTVLEDTMCLDMVPEKILLVIIPVNPCITEEDAETFLQAVRDNDLATVEGMLSAGMDPKDREIHFVRCMDAAGHGNSKTIVHLLLQSYADINKCCLNGYGHTALTKAAHVGDMDLVRFLVQRGAKIDEGNPLLEAAETGHPSVVRYLLEAGAEKNCRGFEDATPLLMAVSFGHHMAVDILLEAKVDVNVRDVRD